MTPALLTDESVLPVNQRSESVSFLGSPSVDGRCKLAPFNNKGPLAFVSPSSSGYSPPQPSGFVPTHPFAAHRPMESWPHHRQHSGSPVDCQHGFLSMATPQYSFGRSHFDGNEGGNSWVPMSRRFQGSESVSFSPPPQSFLGC